MLNHVDNIGGIVTLATDYVLRNYTGEELEEYILEMNDYEVRLARNFLYKIIANAHQKKQTAKKTTVCFYI